jgi:microsomal dipeptidase-like Zn-dependent dipeptidase
MRFIDRVLDHLEHAIEVMGEGAVALGADFVYQLFRAGALPRLLKDTGMPEGITLESAIEGLRGPEDFPNLVEAMRNPSSARSRWIRGFGGLVLAWLLGSDSGELEIV